MSAGLKSLQSLGVSAVERFLYLESPSHHSYTSVGSQFFYHTASACDVWKFSSMRELVVCLHELLGLGLSSGVAQRFT